MKEKIERLKQNREQKVIETDSLRKNIESCQAKIQEYQTKLHVIETENSTARQDYQEALDGQINRFSD